MKTNENGFSTIEVIVVIVVIGLIGAAGWFVYDRQKRSDDKTANQTQSSAIKTQTLANDKSDETTYETYTNKEDGYSFSYPKGWKVGVGGETGSVTANSPDLSIKVQAGPNEFKGAQLSVSKGAVTSTTREEILQNSFFTDVKHITVNDKEALRYKVNQSQEDKGSEVTTVFNGDVRYDLSYSGPESSDYQKYLPYYEKLLESFKF